MNDDVDPPAFRPSRMRVAVTALERESLDPATPSQQPQSDTTFGTLLHRLFQFAHQLDDPTDRAALAALAARGLRTDELAAIDDVPRAASMAADGYLSAQNRPDIVEAFNGVERLYEVPFSLLITDGETDRIVRGTIDCLVRKEDGSITVVELKTGAPRAAHQRQLDVYVRAAQALCGVDRVTGALLYL
jgi:RecB family exonuclease